MIRSVRLTLMALAAFSAASIACLWLAVSGSPAHALASTAALALAARPLLLLLGLSPESIRRLIWTRRGRWRIQRTAGGWERVELLPASTTIVGPLVLLIWRARAQRRCYALLDARVTDRHALRLLLGRLRLEGTGRGAVDNC